MTRRIILAPRLALSTAVLLSVLALLTGAAATATAATLVVALRAPSSNIRAFVARPAKIVITGAGVTVIRARWREWTPESALGLGVAETGHGAGVTHYRVRVVMGRPVTVNLPQAHRAFDQMTVDFDLSGRWRPIRFYPAFGAGEYQWATAQQIRRPGSGLTYALTQP